MLEKHEGDSKTKVELDRKASELDLLMPQLGGHHDFVRVTNVILRGLALPREPACARLLLIRSVVQRTSVVLQHDLYFSEWLKRPERCASMSSNPV